MCHENILNNVKGAMRIFNNVKGAMGIFNNVKGPRENLTMLKVP